MERSYFLFINDMFYQHCNSREEAMRERRAAQRDVPQFTWTVVYVCMTNNKIAGMFIPTLGVLEEI